jgi:hypothetical protein
MNSSNRFIQTTFLNCPSTDIVLQTARTKVQFLAEDFFPFGLNRTMNLVIRLTFVISGVRSAQPIKPY